MGTIIQIQAASKRTLERLVPGQALRILEGKEIYLIDT